LSLVAKQVDYSWTKTISNFM